MEERQKKEVRNIKGKKGRGYGRTGAELVLRTARRGASAVLGIATEKWVMIRGTQWLGILWLGIVIDAVAYLFWALALKGTDNTASIANLAYLTPFLSVIVSAVFLHEKIQVKAIVALIFIVGGILIQNVLGREKNGGETK